MGKFGLLTTRTVLAALAAGMGLAACGSPGSTVIVVTMTATPVSTGSAAPSGGTSSADATAGTVTASPATAQPTVTRTVVQYRTATATATAAPVTTAAPVPQPVPVPNVTDPWAVVSAYYGDVESQNYPEAYALLSSGMTTGQSYQDFVAGYACTGAEQLTENWESGDQVNFDLVAQDSCSGVTRTFTGTDTVVDGKIVAASVTQTS